MPDPKTIRLTDFTQGIQTTDRLDYAPNAVRAGSNVDLGKKVRTRGGISTVDSVGLPANSEIMAIEQVYFPTNEKSFLIAQIHNPVITIPAYEGSPDGDNYDEWEPEFVFGLTSSSPGGFYLFAPPVWEDPPDYHFSVSGAGLYIDEIECLDLGFPVGLKPIDGTGRRGTWELTYPPPDTTYVAIGGGWRVYHPLAEPRTAYSQIYSSSDANPEDWSTDLYSGEMKKFTFTYTKLTLDETIDEAFEDIVTDGTYAYRGLISFGYDLYIDLLMTQTEDKLYIHGNGVTVNWTDDNPGITRAWPAELLQEVTIILYLTQDYAYLVADNTVIYKESTTTESWALYALPDTLPDTGA